MLASPRRTKIEEDDSDALDPADLARLEQAAAPVHVIVPPGGEGERLDKALARLMPEVSRSRIKEWIEQGAVRLNGNTPTARQPTIAGDAIDVIPPLSPEANAFQPEPMALDVVHADESIIVLDKPAGLVVHPGAGNPAHTLQNALLGLDPQLALVPRAGLVHRLDRDTSGLLVVARTVEAHARLVAALAAREIERRYLAICAGVLTAGRTIDEPIGRHRTARTRMAVRSDGRPAVTHVRVVQRYRAHTLVEARLETGRTHQIRVHLAHIGHPILGDPVYGGRRRIPPACGPALLAALAGLKRQALHAARLSLRHPATGQRLEWESPLPADLRALLDALEADLRGAR